MNGIVDIGTWQLAAAYLLLAFPFAFMLWYRIPMIGETVASLLRMTVQLILVGLYLEVIFRLNILWLNALWLVVMVAVADVSIVRSCNLRLGRIALPLSVALVAGTAVPLLLFTGLILRRPNLLDAQYAIPIGGMILGNCMRADIVGIRTFYESIRSTEKAFLQSLAQGASLHEAIRPYVRKAAQAALAPTVATMATIGIVALPGMMTGTILGGASPVTAIKYQIAIMISIFSGTAITVALGIRLTTRGSFTAYGLLDDAIFRGHPKK
ncbi:MAG TPA: ABC transporter permease [Sedimentisphaerales bacterium]|jgi:putative ABC transport system permease protein|nr:ABC transporter permease [Sedimentisphaerales bacterium]HNU28027.1 ABC transporter permease [Sedimentisphaerales bacterium]